MSTSPDTGQPIGVDALISATIEYEKRLEAEGFAQAHEWMFGLREVLLDLRRFEEAVATMMADGDIQRAPEQLKEIVNMMLYQIIPHAGPHMEEVDESLEPFLPEDDDEEDDSE